MSRSWRYYQTADGGDVITKELASLGTAASAAVRETMSRARRDELLPREDKIVRGKIRELRISLDGCEYRVLYAREGKSGQVLLAVHVLHKKSRKLPPKAIRVAERRLADWRSRAR